MSSYNIEIPAQVIQVEVQYEPATERTEDEQWYAKVEVGGVTVMERAYVAAWRGYEMRPDNYAEDSDEAERMILAEFGERLKKLLEG